MKRLIGIGAALVAAGLVAAKVVSVYRSAGAGPDDSAGPNADTNLADDI